jgi:hypothetical protein
MSAIAGAGMAGMAVRLILDAMERGSSTCQACAQEIGGVVLGIRPAKPS